MILENPATVNLLKALVDIGPRGATREYVLQKTGMAQTTFYRVLKPLLRRGLVREESSRFIMPLDTPYNFLFKRLHDVEKLEELKKVDQDRVLAVFAHAKANLGSNLLALWLVGSAAHRQMTSESDLDFLAVVREESDYAPQRSYDVHFIQMASTEFRERWADKDDFVFTALRHGLLLEDYGFAQEFYSKPIPLEIREEEFYKDEDDISGQKDSIVSYIQLKARKEAQAALANYAISIARRMLRVYNVLPAGKPDLLQALHQLFGPTITSVFRESLQNSADQSNDWSTTIMRRAHRLEDIYQAFSSHLGHLQDAASLVAEKAQRFEQLVTQALMQIAPGELEVAPSTGGDLILERNHTRYLFELKSLVGPCTTAPLEQLKRYIDSLPGEAIPVLVINAYRKIPLLEREQNPSLGVRELANKWNIKIVTSLTLLEWVNRYYLGDTMPTFEELIDGHPCVPR